MSNTALLTLPLHDVSGKALDYLVAVAMGWTDKPDDPIQKGFYWNTNDSKSMYGAMVLKSSFTPTSLWSQGGPLKNSNRISTSIKHDGFWMACIYDINDEPTYMLLAQNELEAAMKCLVLSKLGSFVDVPSQLLQHVHYQTLVNLWRKFSDVPTVYEGADVDTIDEPFLHFGKGTHREVVWRWFESMNEKFVVGSIMSDDFKFLSEGLGLGVLPVLSVK